MSLKIEQILDNFFFSEAEPKIYTTGAFLVPMKIMKGEEERYIWVVWEFDDDPYLDVESCKANVYADSLANLIQAQ
jgi:hypothetical protein